MTDQDASAGSAGSAWQLIPLHDRDGWEAALAGIPRGLAHTWGYNAALQATSGHRTSLYLGRAGEDHFVCPIAERKHVGTLDIYTPLGFSGIVGRGDLDWLRRSWSVFVEENGFVAGYVGLHPALAPSGLVEGSRTRSSNSVYLLDLELGDDALTARMSASTRRRLGRSDATTQPIESDRLTLTEAFLRLYPPFMESRGAASVYALSDETLIALCALPEVMLLGFPAERPRAVVMTGSAGYGAEYVFGVAGPDDRQHILPLLWHAARMYTERGEPWLNLGGGIREGDSLAEFKRRLGGRRVPIVSLTQVYLPEMYRQLCDAAGVGRDESYFPAYRSASGSLSAEGRNA